MSANANQQVEVEVKETLTSALWVAKETVEYNLAILNDISEELSEKEKVQGSDLQTWLDKVAVTPVLERFLRGENPLPPEGSNLWDNLPLPNFPIETTTTTKGGDGDAAAGIAR